MYQNCIFDLYGTLIDIRTDESGDNFWSYIAQIYKDNGAYYTVKEVESSYYRLARIEVIKTRALHPFYKNIDIELENVFAKLYLKKGVKPSNEIVADTALKFRKASTKMIKLYDGVIDLLESLKQSGKKIYLLSNAQRCFTCPELIELGIYDYFDGILISSDCCCSKPSKKFFDILFKRYKLNKSESIMIGNDCISDMLGAHRFGIDGLYIHQEISTPLDGKKLICKHKIMDGDVNKMKQYLIKHNP